MEQTIRVSLPGNNALTDADLDHYALIADEDNILIKEKLRGSATVNAFSSVNVAHGLGYIPFCLGFWEVSTGVFRKAFGGSTSVSTSPFFVVTSTDLVLRNPSAAAKVMKYYIFYDNVT